MAHYDSHGVAEASATAALQFEAGMLGTVSVSARTPYQTYLEVAGETGVLSSVNALNVEHPPTVELRRGFEVIERREVSNEQAYAAQVDAFAAAIEEGREFEIPGEEGLRNQLVLDAAFRSVKSGKVESGVIHHRDTKTQRKAFFQHRDHGVIYTENTCVVALLADLMFLMDSPSSRVLCVKRSP